MKCNYQQKVTVKDLASALSAESCRHCGIGIQELLTRGEVLEVCAEEFAYDIEKRTQILEPVALCPTCHEKHHLDGQQQHNPCQVRARLSREGLG